VKHIATLHQAYVINTTFLHRHDFLNIVVRKYFINIKKNWSYVFKTFTGKRDRGNLLFEVSCQKAYNLINICQKILFFIS